MKQELSGPNQLYVLREPLYLGLLFGKVLQSVSRQVTRRLTQVTDITACISSTFKHGNQLVVQGILISIVSKNKLDALRYYKVDEDGIPGLVAQSNWDYDEF